ncbi:MAG: DUF4878 domain-containing protein [Bacteroidia bacterium]|nr:DUF4878 domain-containing protein [Bacteroidia bacterium]
MRRPLLISLALLLILLAGWSSKTIHVEGGNPEKIALKFLQAVELGDYDAAKKLGTAKTGEEIDKLASLDKPPKVRKVKITGSHLGETTGEVYYLYENEPEKVFRLGMVKEGNSWLVETTKIDLDMGNAAPDEAELARMKEVENYNTSAWTTPKEVAKAFLDAIETQDWIRAKALSTEQTRQELNSVSALSKSALNREVTILRSEEDNSASRVYYKVGDDREKVLNLVKSGKNWRVETNKEEISGNSNLKEGLESLDEEINKSMEGLELKLDSVPQDTAP